MINYLIRLAICAVVVYLSPRFLSGINLNQDSYTTAFIVALVMSLLNTFVKPILSFFSFPITVFTLGLFALVINVIIVYICAKLVDGFSVDGFLHPLIFSFVLSIVNSIVSSFQE